VSPLLAGAHVLQRFQEPAQRRDLRSSLSR
jgi:hypothetical protein